MLTEEVIQIANPNIKQPVHYVSVDDEVLGYDVNGSESNPGAVNKQTEEILSRVVAITDLIPDDALINGLASQGDSASFKGNFETWADVPETVWDEQTLGPPPSKNDYIIIVDALLYGNNFNDLVAWEVGNHIEPGEHTSYTIVEDHVEKEHFYQYNGSGSIVITQLTLTPPEDTINFTDVTNEKYRGCWRFKYNKSGGVLYNRNNFIPEYNINSQFTPTQEEVFESGISASKVGAYDEHINISGTTGASLHVTPGLRTAAVDSGINASLVQQITTNRDNIATNVINISTNANDITTINSKIPDTATSSQKLRTSKNIILKTGSETFTSNFTTDAVIIVSGAGTITIQGRGSEDGREISIIPMVDGVFLKINGDSTTGKQLTINTAINYTWNSYNNMWNIVAGQGTYTNTVTFVGQYTDGTNFTFTIPAVAIN